MRSPSPRGCVSASTAQIPTGPRAAGFRYEGLDPTVTAVQGKAREVGGECTAMPLSCQKSKGDWIQYQYSSRCLELPPPINPRMLPLEKCQCEPASPAPMLLVREGTDAGMGQLICWVVLKASAASKGMAFQLLSELPRARQRNCTGSNDIRMKGKRIATYLGSCKIGIEKMGE